jgi:uncharacterized protein
MALFRIGFFKRRFSGSSYFLAGILLVTAGLLLGWYRLHFNQITLFDYQKYIKGHIFPYQIFFPFERMFLAGGYASLVMFVMPLPIWKYPAKALAAIGKLALSNYIFQSLAALVIFSGLGMGNYGRLPAYQLVFVAAEVCMLQIVLSVFWLRFYRTGPAEWLLRKLVYFRQKPRIGKQTIETPVELFS